MSTTDDAAWAECCRMLRNHGRRQRYYHDFLGYNLRMSDLHAAIGVAQLEWLEEFDGLEALRLAQALVDSGLQHSTIASA